MMCTGPSSSYALMDLFLHMLKDSPSLVARCAEAQSPLTAHLGAETTVDSV